MKRIGMQLGGRRNKLGSLHGPRNEENVNGCHAAMLAFLQTNGDAQIPYRFCITSETHAHDECQEDCCTALDAQDIVHALQC
eukprot:10826786-Karenia_brevis.AAC.1